MNIKNIKSFIEFYKFLGITDSISQSPRNIKTYDEKTNTEKHKVLKKIVIKNNSKLEELHQLKSELINLECTLKDIATNVVFSDGNPNSKIMVLGEAPGANEDLVGKPFVGEAGKLLDKMLSFINLSRENFYISNIIFWRPPGNRTPSEKEISICLPITKKHIKIINPKLLILVGSIAAKNLLGSKDGITKLRGKKHIYTDDENQIKIDARAIFHPAYLMRNPIEKKKTWQDLLEIDQLITSKKFYHE